jgi:hypothetical protein
MVRGLGRRLGRLRAAADDWIITEATPDGPARLLKAAQDMFALAFYSYELVACSHAWSIFAVEAALKLRLEGELLVRDRRT